MATFKITAKTLAPHLLTILSEDTEARMSNGENFDDIYIKVTDALIDRVCALANVDPLSLGAVRNEGINRQIIYAERSLRSKGILRKGKRGYYALANPPKGVATDTEAPKEVQEPLPMEEKVEVQKDNAPTQQVAKSSDLGGLLYDRPSSFPSVGIFSDTHFRNIAISQSKCFGRWSGDKRSACSSCPLAQFCFEKQNLDLEAFAARYTLEQQKPQQPQQPKSQAKVKTAPKPQGKGKKKVLSQQQLQNSRKVTAQLEAICKHCNKPIEVGSQTVWVPGDGTYHHDCVEGV